MNLTLNIDMDAKCKECNKPGAADSGICMNCASKCFGGKQMKSAQGKAVQQRINAVMRDAKARSGN